MADQAHYLTRVLRLAAGAPVRVFNGRDGEFDATLAAITKSTAHAASRRARTGSSSRRRTSGSCSRR